MGQFATSPPDLEAIAEAAWRVREMLHLNLPRVAEAGDDVLTHNVIDAINDLNAHLPSPEDGRTWRPATRTAKIPATLGLVWWLEFPFQR